MLFSLLKHYLELYITDTALKVSRSLCCFTTSISHGVENYFLRLWGTGISDAIFIDSYTSINKFYSFIIFILVINAAILLLNFLVLILYLYIHRLSLRHYFLYLNIIPRLWATGISDAIFSTLMD